MTEARRIRTTNADPIEATRELDRHKHTWHRFATCPHALEES